MDLLLATSGIVAFFLVVAGSAYELLRGKALPLGRKRANWTARHVRVAALGMLLMGAGGMLQAAALAVSIEGDAGWRLYWFGAGVFVVGAVVAVPVFLRSRTRLSS